MSVIIRLLVCLSLLSAATACQKQAVHTGISGKGDASPSPTPGLRFDNPGVTIYALDANNVRVGSCSGTWVAPPPDAPPDAKGRVLTCLHCLLSGSRYQALAADDRFYDVNLLTAWVPTGDLVILSVSGIEARETPQAVLAQTPLRKGEPVLLRHAPRGLFRESRSSILSLDRFDDETVGESGSVRVSSDIFTVSLAADPGSSGGGVFNQRGELVGVLNMVSLRETFGIPISRLRDLKRLRPPVSPARFAADYVACRRYAEIFGIPCPLTESAGVPGRLW